MTHSARECAHISAIYHFGRCRYNLELPFFYDILRVTFSQTLYRCYLDPQWCFDVPIHRNNKICNKAAKVNAASLWDDTDILKCPPPFYQKHHFLETNVL